jgi:hypothetical protein
MTAMPMRLPEMHYARSRLSPYDGRCCAENMTRKRQARDFDVDLTTKKYIVQFNNVNATKIPSLIALLHDLHNTAIISAVPIFSDVETKSGNNVGFEPSISRRKTTLKWSWHMQYGRLKDVINISYQISLYKTLYNTTTVINIFSYVVKYCVCHILPDVETTSK